MELELGKNIGMLIRRVIGQSGGVSIQGRSAVCTVFFLIHINSVDLVVSFGGGAMRYMH